MSRLREHLKAASRRLLPTGGSVTERAVKSGFWVTITNVGTRALSFAQLLVLAALLSPADFGLMGIATLTIGAINQFSRLGINQALIQRQEDDVDPYLDTAWTLTAARGLAIGAIVFAAAPLVGAFFGEPEAVPIIRVIALGPVLSGLANPGIVYFEKDLQFHKQFAYQSGAAIASAAVGIGAALIYQSVWALVASSITASVARFALSYGIHGYRPRPRADLDRARELFGYGKWITGLSALVFLTNSGDDVFVGWLLSASALGLYQFAYQLSNTPATEVSHVISSVAFPAYSKVQDDERGLREGYFKTLQLTSFLSFPMAVGIVVVTPTFVRGFLGTKWLPAVTAIQILAIWGLLRALGSTSGPLFQAVGRPDYSTKIQFGKVVIIAALIWPATQRFGIEGTAAVIVANSLLFSEPLVYYLAMETIDGSYRRLARVLGFPAIASALMALSVLGVRRTADLSSSTIEFVVLVTVGVVAYGVVVLLIERQFDYGMESLARTVIRAIAS